MNDETKKTEIAAPKPQLLPVVDTGEFAQLLDSDRFAQIQRVAKLFSESDLVPLVFQGKPANCAVALQMAFRMRVDPMMLMQNMYIIKGRPGIESKLAIALINARGPFKGPVQWRFDGDGDAKTCYAYAVHKHTGEKCEASVSWAMVKAEGWLSKDGSKWKTMPEIMFQYRSAMFLGRLYCPEVLLGLPSDDELHEAEIVVGGSHVIRREIPMPQPKSAPESTGSPPIIDVTTGEIKGEAGPPGPGATGPSAVAEDVWKGPASEAQRRAIMATGKRLNLNDEEINTIVQDATTFTVATLPMGAVNAALGALAKYKPEA